MTVRVVDCLVVAVMLATAGPVAAAERVPSLRDPVLNEAYRAMYALDFQAAEQRLDAWQRAHPGNPIGPVSKAGSVLFRELDRLAILESRLFQDEAFVSRNKLAPDSARAAEFKKAIGETESLAKKALASRPNDPDALFALTLANGLQADYASLIENRNMASLSYTREATRWAGRLLAVDPQCYDAYLATGISYYIIGSMPAPFRWVLRIGGYVGDKQRGVREVQLVAERGTLLAPFARILLAVADLRDGNRMAALVLLRGLQREFPSNPLFARELHRLENGSL